MNMKFTFLCSLCYMAKYCLIYLQEQFDDTKGATRNRKLKNTQYKHHKKTDKRTNEDLHITLHRIRKFKQHEPHKNRDNTDALQRLAVPPALETTVALLLNNIKVDDGFTIYIDMHLPSRLSSRPGTHLKCLQFQKPTHHHGISSVSL